MYYPQSSSGMPTEQGRYPINLRRRKERDKVSEVWKTFYVSPVEPNAVVCRLCSVTLSYVGGSTSGMRNHLQNKHRHIIPKAFSSSTAGGSSSSRRTGESVINPLSNIRYSSENHPVPSISPIPVQSQFNHSASCFPATSTQNNSSSSPTCLSPPSPYTGNGESNTGLVSSRLAREVAVMCATDLLSPQLVDGKGFHRIFRLLSGNSQSADLSSITSQSVRSAMKDLQFSLRLKIQRQLSTCARTPSGEYKKDVVPKRRPVSLILCPWTQINAPASNEFWEGEAASPVVQCSGYVDVRAQFLGDDWHPESRLLGTLPNPSLSNTASQQDLKSSAEALSVAIQHLITTTYELNDAQIVACVYPKCPLLDACVKSFGWSSVPCVAHILDKVVENAFDSSCDLNILTSNAPDNRTGNSCSSTNTKIATAAKLTAEANSSKFKNKFGKVKDIVVYGVDLWKIEKKSKQGKADPPQESDISFISPFGDGILENIHWLNDSDLHNTLFTQRRGRWRVWCRFLENLNELSSANSRDSGFMDWKKNLASLLPTVVRLGTAWEALSSGGPSISDDIPLLSCALPILCSLPYCPSLGEFGNECGNESLASHEETASASNESTGEVSIRSADLKQKEHDSECDTAGTSVRQKLKVSLESVLNIEKSEELKGAALLMALASFVQQEVLRQMSMEECVANAENKSNKESPKGGESHKRPSSMGNMNSSFCKRSKLEDLLHGVFGYSTAPDITDISHEIEHYIGEPIAPLSQVPGIWWRQRESKYPRLSQMARRLLTIPASVSTGRGSTSTLHLPPEDITTILFLHSNLTVSDLEEMGFEVDGEEDGWRKHQKGDEEDDGRDDTMDMREDEAKDYDESGRVVDEEHFFELETVCREPHMIKKEPVCLGE
ncbi:hypothetical protein J437_LFUL000476 [Ladona fulva]|uniref:BED-type domain-containing protein n=1 Tax=Ladona fulva TaxID=123851 RepID=A0A8K0KPS1_LADFU|nr:hypothetical protein J437_LFUL000476 [Ladona fulva]